MVKCRCIFLDGKDVEITIEADAKGSDLFETLCRYLNIKFTEPFGVVFRGGAGPSSYNWWIRMNKPLKRQIPGKCKVWEFAFIVKYYPTSLAGLQENAARFQVCSQIRQDLFTGRLVCPSQTMALLCSYWLQSEYGDWTSRQVDLQLLDAFRYVQKGLHEQEDGDNKSDIVFSEQMMQLHQTHRGMTATDADYRFLKLASSLAGYGIHFYPAYEPKKIQETKKLLTLPNSKENTLAMRGSKLIIGIGPQGIHQRKKNSNEVVYMWKAMRAVSFKQNKVVVKLQGSLRKNAPIDFEKENSKEDKTGKNIVKEYLFEDMYQTKIVWQAVIENHVYFRVNKQGIKGEQRRRMLSSLRIKRSIPMVGEKRAGPSVSSPKISPRSLTSFDFDLTAPLSPSMPTEDTASLSANGSLGPQLPELGDIKTEATAPLPMEDAPLPKKESDAMHNNEKEDEVEGVIQSPIRSDTFRRAMSKDYAAKPKIKPAMPVGFSNRFQFPSKPKVQVSTKPIRQPSLTTTSGEENLSDETDNTEVLCSPSIIERTFNFSEKHGVNNIGYWEELNSPRGRSRSPKGRNRNSEESKPPIPLPRGSTRSQSGDRIPPPIEKPSSEPYKPLPFVVPAEIIMETKTYNREDQPEVVIASNRTGTNRNRPRSVIDFPLELDELFPYHKMYQHHASVRPAYVREYSRNVSDAPSDRQYKSMSSLNQKTSATARLFQQDKPIPNRRNTSPVRAKTTSDEQRAGARRKSRNNAPNPKRAASESRLPQRRVKNADKEKSNRDVTDRWGVRSEEEFFGRLNTLPPKQSSMDGLTADDIFATRNTIPKIPVFIRSVV